MISVQDQKTLPSNDMIKKLYAMLDDISQYGNKDKQELMKEYVSERLEKSNNVYLEQIKFSLSYLSSKRPEYIMRKIKRL